MENENNPIDACDFGQHFFLHSFPPLSGSPPPRGEMRISLQRSPLRMLFFFLNDGIIKLICVIDNFIRVSV